MSRTQFALLLVAAVVSSRPAKATDIQIPLNYNRNSIYQGTVDTGFNSIADRGLITNGSTVFTGPSLSSTTVITNGIQDFTSSATNLSYHFVSTPNVNDTVALTATTGSNSTDTTTLAQPILMTSQSTLGVLDNFSNGGGTFDMVLHFTNSSQVTLTLGAADWVGTGAPPAPSNGLATQSMVVQPGLGYTNGTVDGTGGTNNPFHDLNLQLVQSTVTGALLLAGQGFNWNGLQLDSITFDNKVTSSNGAAGIYAVTVTPEPASFVLAGLGAIGLLVVARRRRKA